MDQSISNSTESQTAGEAVDGSLSYEAAFEQLQRVLGALESGDLPLNEALNQYERGAALADHCMKQLDEAELRVRRWLPAETSDASGAGIGAGDELATVDLDDWT